MQAALTAVPDAFPQVPAARRLACGITAHLVDPSHIEPARAWRFERHDRVTRARHTGWYADCDQFETLTGFVYALADDADDADGDHEDVDDPPVSYYALAESNDSDCHFLDPDVYDDPVAAAHAADRMAELVAELERECDEVRGHAMRARRALADANDTRRDALAILRHLRDGPADGESLGPAFARLWAHADAARRRAFRIVDAHRPPPRSRPFDAEGTPTPAECRADAWRGGWDDGAAA